MTAVLAALLLAHMVADYPLQSDWMAENKHDDPDALTSHSLVHFSTVAVAVFAFTTDVSLALAIAFPMGILHGAIDALDLDIRTDQTLHLITCVVFAVVALLP